MDEDKKIQEQKDKMNNTWKLQSSSHEVLNDIEGRVENQLAEGDELVKRIDEMASEKEQQQNVPPEPQKQEGAGLEEQMLKMLQGTLDKFENKFSDRLMDMIKKMPATGAARDQQIREIKQVAIDENVDLSLLFSSDDIKSNIDSVGIKEKETKSVDSSLDKLKKMRGGG